MNIMKKIHRRLLPSRGPRGLFIAIGIVVLGVAALAYLINTNREISIMTYSEFLDLVENNKVEVVRVIGQELHGRLKDGLRFETTIADTPKNWEILREHKVIIGIETPGSQ